MIGENASPSRPAQPDLDEGDEIGNHSYTHPNLAQVSDTRRKLELNATQRLIEAYTGRSMRLFRAPYFGDAEPTTGGRTRPGPARAESGYITVGLHVDTEDWKRPGAEAIVDKRSAQVLARRCRTARANIVLLHDGGGDRAQTVAALPRIIDGLRARGYPLRARLASWSG